MFDSNTESVIVFVALCFLVILLLITFVALIIYHYQKNQNIHYNNIQSLKSNHDNLILQSQIEIQEQTFQKISREIHDNIGQKLSLVKLHLIKNEAAGNLLINTESVRIISEVIKDLSDLSRSMSSEYILNNGMIAAVKEEVAYLEQAGKYKIDLEICGDCYYSDNSVELVLFRIVQEALHNIIKHSEASIITLKFIYEPHYILLTIKDDGKGFSTEQKEFSGNGLSNMKKRAITIGGDYSISSNPGKGTTLIIKIPVNEKEAKDQNNTNR